MSERLLTALDQIKDMDTITLGQVVDRIEGEALLILCLIAILPFMQPIPIPGLSSILGLIVLLQGVGMVVFGKPLLTKKLRMVVISHEKFEVIHRAATKFSNLISKISAFKHPLVASRPSHIISGISIILSSAFLSLPLPIPFSNLIPAMSIFLICIGLLEEDIVLILMGHGITLTVIWMTIYSYQIIREQFHSWF
jgi:hypothetical protein